MRELKEYEPKGTKRIPQVKVSKGVYEAFMNYYNKFEETYYCKDINVWANVRCGIRLKYESFFANLTGVGEVGKYRAILSNACVNGLIIRHFKKDVNLTDSKDVELGLKYLLEITTGNRKDIELVMDASLSNDVITRCRPQDAKREFKAAIEKSFTKEEFELFVDKNGLSEEEKVANHIKPRHSDTFTNGEVIKFNDCVYQDIHKAHASYLLETFKDYPLITNVVNNHLVQAKKAKKNKQLDIAKMHKDYVNIVVGCLGQRYKADSLQHKQDEDVKWLLDTSTRSLYNKCVAITRGKIDKQIKYLSNSIFKTKELYANTDGFILQHPRWENVKHSEEIGEFGIEEVRNNEVWFYSVKSDDNQTGYSIHQYYDNEGNKHIVGNLPDVLKEKVDLSKGQVVKYKQKVISQLDYIYYDKVEVINTNIKEK